MRKTGVVALSQGCVARNWDIERKRYPQYDHCAVIIAEDITSRFLNVIALFNGAVPLIAIQMRALRIGDVLTLDFATVVNELTRGLVDEDEDAQSAPADRGYWESRATKETVAIADDLLALARIADPTLELNYTKFYIGLHRHGQVCNFATFRPRKTHLILGVRLPETEELTAKLEACGIETQPYERRDGAYRLRLAKKDLASRKELLTELLSLACKEQGD